MCFSLILLSVDLSSPHVKNKMSKREFIRNTRGAVGAEGDNRCFLLHIVKTSVDASPTVSHNHEKKELSSVGRGLEEDLYGSLYDNIFLRGHIGRSPNFFKRVNLNKNLVFLSGRGASSGPGQTTICSRIPRTLSLETSFSQDWRFARSHLLFLFILRWQRGRKPISQSSTSQPTHLNKPLDASCSTFVWQ